MPYACSCFGSSFYALNNGPHVMHHLSKPHAGQNKAQSYAGISGADEVRDGWSDDGQDGEKIPPLTRKEAQLLKEKLQGVSLEAFLLKLLMWQALSAIAIAALAWLVSSSAAVVTSAFYGAVCVVLPSALVARVVIKRIRPDVLKQSGGMLTGLVVLELVKILVTVCLLLAAPLVLDSPQWVAIVIGFAVTLKVYWVVALMSLRQPGHVKKIGISE